MTAPTIGRVGSIWRLAGLQHVTIYVTLLSVAIKGFRHKGLEQFFATGTKRGIQPKQADRLRLILGVLNAATTPLDMNLPGLGLHELQGTRKGTWAVKVSGNWRLTFRFADKDAEHVDYEDYH
jgi:toxin HigB-1